MTSWPLTRRRRQKRFVWVASASVVLSTCFYFPPSVEASTGFPGTIKTTPTSEWWHSPPLPSSEDEEDDAPSSSDWESWAEAEQSDSSDEEAEMEELNKRQDVEATENQTKSSLPPVSIEKEPAPETPKIRAPAADESPSAIDMSAPRSWKRSLSPPAPSSKPLQTLEKLQQMLDETDYMTSKRKGAATNTNQNTYPNTNTNTAESTSIDSIANSENSEWESEDSNDEEDDERVVSSRVPEVATEPDPQDPLWTSKDRRKYKKQQKLSLQKQQESSAQYFYEDPHRLQEYQQKRILQQRQQRRQEQQRQQQQQRLLQKQQQQQQQHIGHSSDAEDQSDTDDGLGYVLPNLPVYLSDAEGDDSDLEAILPQAAEATTNSQSSKPKEEPSSSNNPPPPPQPLQTVPNGVYYPPYGPPPPQAYAQHQQGGYYPPPPHGYPPHNGGYPYPYPPPSYYGPQQQQQQNQQHQQHHHQQQQQHHQQHHRQQYPYGQQQQPQYQYGPPPPNYYYPRPALAARPDTTVPRQPRAATHHQLTPLDAANTQNPSYPVVTTVPSTEAVAIIEQSDTIVQTPKYRLTFDSMQKAATCLVLSAICCYSAVSPRSLPLVEYNQHFYYNMRIASLAMVPPSLVSLLVMDLTENDINRLASCFYNAFTVGYVLVFLLEIISTTIIRLAVFLCWERNIFQLVPKVPLLVLPWVLREHKYRPKRITLFAADVITSCIISPLIEEWFKLVILQWTVQLPRNFRWIAKTKTKNKRGKKWVAEAIPRTAPTDADVTKVNIYVASMLAVSLGIKLADVGRRVCMYTKATNLDKSFYAVCRGIFPIHELCGTLTALALARRDVLGQRMPFWKMVLPAAIFHGMANFRGMKPIFKWNSGTPWSEMQLSPTIVGDDLTMAQLAGKAFPKVMWLIILGRVMGYCVKNYYLINRQAVKRATMYAGKHAAFSAELAATEMLQKNKKD